MIQKITETNFSVLMSLYNAEKAKYLEECLSSLNSQEVKATEVVLVLDGPIHSELLEVIRRWEAPLNIVVVPLKHNVGLGKALNYGLHKCNFELVARMDTDDICDPSRFKKQILAFNNSPNLSICGTGIREFQSTVSNVISYRIPPLSSEDILLDCINKNPFNHMTVMYKKSHVMSVGSYRDLPWMEDWYLWLRMLEHGYEGINLDDNLVSARTGIAMISRRSGLKYIVSEWKLTNIKVDLNFTSWPVAFKIFIMRSFPRLLPKSLLLRLYTYSRKNHNKIH
jgi:glycosyltransferase involved in cell wall biosynthesis